jgi:hypothetical protein
MKKIFLFATVALVLNSCSSGTVSDRHIKELEDRISKLEANVLTMQFNEGKVVQKPKVEEKKVEEVKVVEGNISESSEEKEEVVVKVPDPKLFEITDPKEGANLNTEPITFVGKVDKRATKITVKYVGVDSKDEYVLKNFKEGDESFWYKASSAFGNLSKGKNTYEFIADFSDGDKVALSPIVINYK